MTYLLPKLTASYHKRLFELFFKLDKNEFKKLAATFSGIKRIEINPEYPLAEGESYLVIEEREEDVKFYKTIKEMFSEITRQVVTTGEMTEKTSWFEELAQSIEIHIRVSLMIAIYLYQHRLVASRNYAGDIIKGINPFMDMFWKEMIMSRSNRPLVDERHRTANLFNLKNFAEYLTKATKSLVLFEHYLEVVLVFKILCEVMDLPLKGKNLEEYKKVIFEACEKIKNE